MTDTYERCSCGDCPFGTPRDRAKCSKESLSGGGKMCVKELKSKDENGYPYWDATTFYPEGFVVRWSDGTIVKAKQTTCGNPDDWYDPEGVDKYENALEHLEELPTKEKM